MTRTRFDSRRKASFFPLVLVGVIAVAPSAARAETVDDIIAANIAASGGEAIARIENFTSTGSVAVDIPALGTLDGTIEAVRIPGRGYFESVHIGPIYQQQGWDGKQAWQRGPAGLRILEGYEAAALALQSFANTFVALRELAPAGLAIEPLDDAEIDGRPQRVLAIRTDSDAPATLYLDRDTSLLTRSVARADENQPPIVVDVGDYAAYEGVMMPTSVTITVEGTSTTHVTLDTTVINTSVDESIFAVPGN
jgi:hypothetical protein